MESFISKVIEIDERFFGWEFVLFVVMLYSPIFLKVFEMGLEDSLDVAIATLAVAVLTFFVAVLTFWIAKQSNDLAKSALKISQLELNNPLIIKLYEFKELVQVQNGSYGKIIYDFLERQSIAHAELIYALKDRTNSNLLMKKDTRESLINLLNFYLKDKDSGYIFIGENKVAHRDFIREYCREKDTAEGEIRELVEGRNISGEQNLVEQLAINSEKIIENAIKDLQSFTHN